MLKFRPSNLAQKRPNISFNELQLIALIEKGLSDNSLRGLLYKRSSSSSKWRLKWFLLFENLLFYFDLGSQKQQDQQHQKEQKEQLQQEQQRQRQLIKQAEQQQQQQQQHPSASKSPSRSSFSSLIRRRSQSKGHQQEKRSDNQVGQVSLTPTHRTRNDVLLEPRRASISDTFTRLGKATATTSNEPTTDQREQTQRSQQTTATCAPLAPPRSRQRLSSDPQNSGANIISGGVSLNARSELSLNYHEHSILNHTSVSKTLNSSSISGVSNHFQIHNEQTIGRSTTTTAGKTASASANYSSLLNRKIGVIFLEGSYCERLVDSAANFIGESGALTAPTLAKRCSSSGADSDLTAQFSSAFQNLNSKSNPLRANSLIGTLRTKQDDEELELNCIFSLTWKKEGSKAYQFRSETEAECLTWVHAISNARYSILLNDKEQLEQKYLHLSQIIESESTAKWQYSKQCEELSIEIKKLRQEICLLKRQENHSNHLRLVLSKSAAIVETILRQQRRRQQQQNQAEQTRNFHAAASSSPLSSNQVQVVSKTSDQDAACKQSANLVGPSGIIGLGVGIGNEKANAKANENKSIKHGSISSGSSSNNNNKANKAGSDNKLNSSKQGDTEGDDHEDDALCDLISSRPNSVAALASSSGEAQPVASNSMLPLGLGLVGRANSRHEALLKRTRSMEQEQEEHELAVRRTRRTASHLRQSSTIGFATTSSSNGGASRNILIDKLTDDNEQQRRSTEEALKSLVRSARRIESNNDRFISKRHRSVDQLVLGNKNKLAKRIDQHHYQQQQQQSKQLSNNSLANKNTNKLAADFSQQEADSIRANDDYKIANDDEQCLLADADEQALSIELKTVVEALNKGILLSGCLLEVENSEEIRKIKKVQGFFRGWLCRRRWKQIVQEYIKSPHAESMRKRNNLVFKMVECEEEYVEQLTLLISSFLRPIKMAASSQKPALDHDELNSIFLNSETLLFLHQIFLKGLTARMESWPTLVLGDLFNMLLPMLTIYQEYVRNHHFSLQVLAECKQREQFSSILRRLEDKPQLNGRTLETFLTYPMHQIPRYIICLHEILAHTPHNHVERASLYAAQTKLEELSRQMHDEVSETENIRQNLAIERMIIGGCDILLDVNQVFVRQGILLQVVEQPAKGGKSRSRLASFASRSSNINSSPVNSSSKFQNDDRFHQFNQQAIFSNLNNANSTGNIAAFSYQQQNFPDNQSQTTTTTTVPSSSNIATTELIRQCFLFTNHLLLCTRTKDGKLHLLEGIGRISLTEVTLIENPLEFIQQQETIVANIESIPTGIAQQSKVTPNQPPTTTTGVQQQASAKDSEQQRKSDKKSSFNSISDYHSHTGYSEGVSGNENDGQKRASTISIPAKWGQTNCNANQQGNSIGSSNNNNNNNNIGKIRSEKRVSYVGFEDQANNGTSRSSVFSVTGSASASASGHYFSQLAEDRGLKSSITSTSANSAWLVQGAAIGPQSTTTSNQNQNLNQSSNSNLNHSNSNENPNLANEQETKAHLLQELPAISNKQHASNSIGYNNNNSTSHEEIVCSTFKIDPTSSSSPNKQTGSSSSSSSRGKIAAYLASKLYNLTNLASGSNFSSTNNIQSQQQQHHATSSMSAPPSPLNKRAGGAPRRQPLRSSCVCYGPDQLPFYLSKDYGGCDFILFVESTSKPVMSMSSSMANNRHSGSGLQAQHHHQHGISHHQHQHHHHSQHHHNHHNQHHHHHHHATNIASSNHHSGNVTSGSHHQHHSNSNHHSSAMGIPYQSRNSSVSCGSGGGGGPIIIHLVAPNLQEKAAWMSDISQCIDNVHFNDLFHGSVNDSASVTMNQSVRTDPRLYKDDVDIKFSRALNSCKLPQIRYASKDRLFERLTDLRFLSIDFLNTFLLTYRVFTSAEDVLEALKSVHYNCDRYYQQQQQQQQSQQHHQLGGDSLSAFANSSLSSLNTQQTNISPEKNQREQSEIKLDTNYSKSQSQAMTGSNSSIDKKRDTQRNSFTSGQIQHQIGNQKPIIPPRSPGADLNAKLNAQMENSKFLMAPNAQHQKRRSTISALTPITGSTSSSLVNLNSCVFKNVNPSNIQQQPHPLNANCSNASKILTNSKNNQQVTNPLHRSANDDLNLTLSEDDGDINYNLEDSCDERQLTANEISNPTERMRSSSMTDHSIRPLIITSTTKARNLDVPICRQVRASSLSHVSDCAQILTTARCESFKNQALNSSSGNEHWRLSYKKMAGELAANSNNVKQSENIFCGRTSYLSAGPPPNVTPRRASSSDVNVTFHVTLDPPPNETTSKTSDDDQSNINLNHSTAPSPSSPISLSCSSPKVPPSTPIDPSSDNEVEADRSGAHSIETSSQPAKTHCDKNPQAIDNNENHLHKKVTTNNRLSEQHLTVDTRRSYSKQQQQRNSYKIRERSSNKVVAVDSSNSSLVVTDDSSSSDSSSTTTSTCSTNQLNSRSTKPILSSQSESGLIQSSSSLESIDVVGRQHNSLKSKSMKGRRQKNPRSRINDGLSSPNDQRKKARDCFVLKEIELTEIKTIDYDTSADEDKISTSSDGEDNLDNDDEDSDSNLTNEKGIDENNNESKPLDLSIENNVGGEDDKSSELLSKLSKLQINKNSSDEDIGSMALIRSKDDGLDGEAMTQNRKQKIYNDQDRTKEVRDHHYNDSMIKKEKAEREEEEFKAVSTIRHRKLSGHIGQLLDMQTEQVNNSTNNEKYLQQQSELYTTQVDGNQTTTSQNKPSIIRSPRSSICKSGDTFKTASNKNSTSQAVAASLSCTSSQGKSLSCTQQVEGLQSSITTTTTNSSSRMTTPRSSFHHTPDTSSTGERISKAGVIVTASSPRVTSRRSSTASAASAFAAATAASNNPILTQPPNSLRNLATFNQQQTRKLSTDLTQRSGNNINLDSSISGQLDSAQCNCANIHRGSIGSQANQSISSNGMFQPYKHIQKSGDISRSFNLSQNNQFIHYPSCAYFQHINLVSPSNTPSNSYHVPPSEASSLCNSRASSRLSSCAGLDYSSYSSAQVNFYSSNPHQQFVAMNQVTSSPTNVQKGQITSRVMASNGMISGSSVGGSSNQAINVNRCGSSAKSSKRNSSQINIRSVATIRVLSVLRHWVSKHSQDFVNDTKLSYLVQEFLQDLIMDTNLLPAEHKAALQLQQMVQKAAHARGTQIDLDLLLAPPSKPSTDSIETLSALEIAEGMTYLDHKIFLAIRSEEFLGQAWMKIDKAIKAPHILLITKRFNDVSRLVSSEIIRVPELHRRVAIIEKWTNVAHICRVVHNFNGVLQICAAFTNSAVFRLKKTWDKIPKTTKTTIDQLQSLVSTDSRFRNMRDAINRCDPPSIPYVGMYLTDLSFIEEGTPNYSPDGLLNFSKMRMIAHVIREIQHLQNGSYKIELNHRVANYLLDSSRHLQDDEMYRCSLAIEPRSSGGKNGVQILNSVSSSTPHNNGPSPSSSSNQQISSSLNPTPTPPLPAPSKNTSTQNLSSSKINTSSISNNSNNNINNYNNNNFSNNSNNNSQTTP